MLHSADVGPSAGLDRGDMCIIDWDAHSAIFVVVILWLMMYLVGITLGFIGLHDLI